MAKRKFVLSLLSILPIIGLGLSSCNNVEPIPGEQGPIGPEGPQGEKGDDGEDGSIIHTGEGKPEDSLGKDTDIYIDSKTGDLYTKNNGSWTLTMNIKGEDGKDGQDGSNGHNGSSGSDGKTAWSNTILPSNDGYITVSSGSTLEGNNVTFTFVPTNELSEGETLEWSVKDKDNNEVTDLENDDNSFTFETTMKKGGFVVSAEIIEPNIQNVASKDQLLESLNNLEEGENIIILNQDITLDAEDITDKTRINNVSTLANNNDDIDNFFRTGKIVLKNENKKPANVKIMANGKGRTFKFPFLTIIGENIGTFTFNNVKLVCDYDLDKIGNTNLTNYHNFINATGVDEIKINNVDFTTILNDRYTPKEYLANGTPNFINFDGSKISLNNFKQLPQNSSFSWAFIGIEDDIRNENLSEVYINNSDIYTSMPFFINYYHNENTPLHKLTLNINNTNFYNCKRGKLMPFIALYSWFDNPNEVKLDLSLNINNVNYNSYFDNLFPIFLNGNDNGIISITDYNSGYPYKDATPDDLIILDVSEYAIDYNDKIKVNINNYYENKIKVEEDKTLLIMPDLKYIVMYPDENDTDDFVIAWDMNHYNSLVKDRKYYVEHVVKLANKNWADYKLYKVNQDSYKFPSIILNGVSLYD